MKFDYPHSLVREDAHKRLMRLGEYLNNRHGINVNWNGETGRFRGKYLMISFEGALSLGEGVVHVTGEDPGLLLRKKAVGYLKEKLEAYLDPRVPFEELPTGA